MEPIKVFPHGLSLGQGTFRSAMIFKSKDEADVLPIWLDSGEASVLLSSVQTQREEALYRAVLKVFEVLGVSVEGVLFNEVSNSTQYALVTVNQRDLKTKVRLRASEAIALALNTGCEFWTDHQMIEKSRTLSFQNMLHGLPESTPTKDGKALH